MIDILTIDKLTYRHIIDKIDVLQKHKAAVITTALGAYTIYHSTFNDLVLVVSNDQWSKMN